MATCVVVGDQLEVRLSAWEKAEAVHGDISVALASLRSAEIVEDAMAYIHGLRVGTGIPGSTAVGTFTSKAARIFAVVHHGHHRGVRIVLEGAPFDEVILGYDDPEELVARLPLQS